MSSNIDEEPAVPAELSECRDLIARIDRDIVALLQKRLELARRTGTLKRENGLPILDPGREAKVIRNAVTAARAAGLKEESVREIFWLILGLSREAQQASEG